MRLLSMVRKRLYRKFVLGVVLILLFTLAGTLFANSWLVERFYLHEKREYVEAIGDLLAEEIERGNDPQETIRTVEEQEKVLIVHSGERNAPDVLANELREKFREKGLGFQRLWLWDQDYERAVEQGSQFRLYSQNKMDYSILVQYLLLESGMYAIAAIVPDAGGFLSIVNHIGFLIYFFAAAVATGLIFVMTRHITKPLTEICAFTRKISSHDYEPLRIRTGDELEEVANSLNDMAAHIEQYQKMLEEKNEQMKQLLNDVAHDLKTPVSLVRMYAAGIQDGLDDGTFLDTIVRQNDKMSQIVEKLLHLSRIEQREYPCETLSLDQVLARCVKEHKILFEQRNLELRESIQPGLAFKGNGELLGELFSNLLSNAAKYAAPGAVTVELRRENGEYRFRISNLTENEDLDPDLIWQPFYVGEGSRNKELSGTGLGLSIVKKIAEQFRYGVSCLRDGREISFEVRFPAE